MSEPTMTDETMVMAAKISLDLADVFKKYVKTMPREQVVLMVINYALMLAVDHGYTEQDLLALLSILRTQMAGFVEDAPPEVLQMMVTEVVDHRMSHQKDLSIEEIAKLEALKNDPENFRQKIGDEIAEVFELKERKIQ